MGDGSAGRGGQGQGGGLTEVARDGTGDDPAEPSYYIPRPVKRGNHQLLYPS